MQGGASCCSGRDVCWLAIQNGWHTCSSKMYASKNVWLLSGVLDPDRLAYIQNARPKVMSTSIERQMASLLNIHRVAFILCSNTSTCSISLRNIERLHAGLRCYSTVQGWPKVTLLERQLKIARSRFTGKLTSSKLDTLKKSFFRPYCE